MPAWLTGAGACAQLDTAANNERRKAKTAGTLWRASTLARRRLTHLLAHPPPPHPHSPPGTVTLT
jgi:hypothetical protein